MTHPGGAQTPGISLAGPAEASDLATLLSRARSLDANAAVRLQGFGHALATWVPVIYPTNILDPSPVVLGLRAMSLAHPTDLDLTVPVSASLDRLARFSLSDPALGSEPVHISAPPQEVSAPWAGMVAPRGGWTKRGVVSAHHVRDVARAGIQKVADAVPNDSGAAIVSKVRSEIWGASSGWGPMEVPDIPDGAAFGLDVLGFIPPSEFEVAVAAEQTGQWLRLSTEAGHVVVKNGQR